VHSALQQQLLPALTTQDLEQIIELQRALNMDNGGDAASPHSLQFLNTFTNEARPTAPSFLFSISLIHFSCLLTRTFLFPYFTCLIFPPYPMMAS